MIDQRIIDISRRQTAANLRERWHSLDRAIVERVSEFVLHGQASSGRAVLEVAEMCGAAARTAVQLSWQQLWRAALTIGVGPSPGLADKLKGEVRRQTGEDFAALVAKLENHERRVGGGGVGSARDVLHQAREGALELVDAEIDLAIASLERRAEREGVSTIYQFYAPVGAVISGPHATGSGLVNIGAAEKAQLETAIREIQSAIEDAEELRVDKVDLAELARDALNELQRAKPNRHRLASILGGIGQAVQAVASIGPAYQGLKAAAAMAGVHLPW